MDPVIALLAAISGYLLGSISFARVGVGLFAPHRDLAELTVSVVGTEEEAELDIFGASAASTILGPRLGGVVALFDMLKVALPVLVFKLWRPDQPYFFVVSLAGLVGHNWPVYYRFKGGRGFSVILGSFLVIDWLGALVTLVVGMFFGMAVLASPTVADVAWLVLMIPWMGLRHHSSIHLLYAIFANLLFLVAAIPDIRRMRKYRREGKLDAYMEGRRTLSSRRRGMQAICDYAKRVRRTVLGSKEKRAE